jgi:hypothetical protein
LTPAPSTNGTPAPAPVGNGKCDLPSRDHFRRHAKPVSVMVDGSTLLTADPKEFSTGSLGWFVNGKATVVVDGKPVRVQVSGTLTAVHSKELPK